jgi:hypothetical protein
MRHATGAIAIALAATLAPLASMAADATLAISAQIVGYCRFAQPVHHLIFGEIDATDHRILTPTATVEYECSDGVTGQLQVDGKAQGPLTRHLMRVGSPAARLPYQIEWTAPEPSQAASPGMVSSTVTLTGTMLPAHYRAAPAAPDYFDTLTLTLNP